MKQQAITKAVKAQKKAVLLPGHTTRVGACIYTSTGLYSGFNVQNCSHKSYHAEELAVLRWLARNGKVAPIGIVIAFNNITPRTFMCGHCRQIVWELTKNPDLIVTECNEQGAIIAETTLRDLYPHPFPRGEFNE